MKKIVITVITVFTVWQGQAQSAFFNDSLRSQLSEYLQKVEATGSKHYDEVFLCIWNLLSNQDASKDNSDIGIYGFQVLGSHQYQYILLKYYEEHHILQLSAPFSGTRAFSEVLNEFLDYFDQNKDLDRRLLPFYTKALYDCYIYNTRIEQLGEWFEWYEKDHKKYTDQLQY